MLLGDHAVVHNRPCLVTAVDQRMFATVTLLDEPTFQLEAPDVGIEGYHKSMHELGLGDVPKGARFVEQAIKNALALNVIPAKAGIQGSGSRIKSGMTNMIGVRVVTRSEFSSQFGFGSSSSSTVCVVKALSELLDLGLSNKQLFDVAYKTVIDIQGVGSGFDIAAGIYGGTLYFVGGGKVIEPIEIDSLPLIVGYSGTKGDTSTLVKMVGAKLSENPELFDALFNASTAAVEAGRKALAAHDIETLAKLFVVGEGLMVSYGVEIPKLSAMIYTSISAGAWGAKMSGAGGGDCMIALAAYDKIEHIKAEIMKVGGELIDVETNAHGVRIEATI